MPTLLITGANRGIGLEFARQYAHDAWNVIACCRMPAQAEILQALAKTHPSLRIEALDVSNEQSIETLAATLKDTPIDLLINNAGIFSGTGTPGRDFPNDNDDKSQEFGSIKAEAWSKVLQINTIAPIMVIQAFASHLRKGLGKKIINITSGMGSITNMGAGSIAYRSSKAALNAAMRVIKHDIDKDHLTIVNFHPGWVQTDMGGARANLTPEQSVTAMRGIIARLKPENSGQFLSYEGNVIPW